MAILNRAESGRFHKDVITRSPDECWTWVGRTNAYGYGRFRWNNQDWPAFAISYMHWVGPVPEGTVLDHRCHTQALAAGDCQGGRCSHRLCVNPAHLEPVSWAENVRRADHGKGRPRPVRPPPGSERPSP